MGWLNLASIVLGLAALALPLAACARCRTGKGCGYSSAISFLCCALALLAQIRYHLHLVQIKDWSALMDTAGAVWMACAGLAVATLAFNALLLTAGWKKQ